MPLKIADRLYVWTPNGEREIQLCLGDITHLRHDEKVDVIFISAFPGDYAAVRGTVIGALKKNLRLDVGKVAKYHKKEDLRTQFNCWISKTLPDYLPYRQLMCYEQCLAQIRQKSDFKLTDGIAQMFRALMPIFNNENKSVITPVLATGNQGGDKAETLQLMLKQAIAWMHMGLPLQLFKITLFVRGDDLTQIGRDEQQCVKVFEQVKAKYEGIKYVPKGPTLLYDVFLVYSTKDTEEAALVQSKLRKIKPKVKVTSVYDLGAREDNWQHEVFMAMLASARVVPLLSEPFVNEIKCIDQYNVALCCNRRTRRHLMAPLCLERLQLPVYMNMVQWMNCRMRDQEKIQNACLSLMDQILDTNDKKGPEKTKYDIFVSYAHKNLEEAKLFLHQLQKHGPKLKIFFDYEELKTGVSWQQALYQALDNSRSMLALLSKDYLSSKVCNEEFNLGLAKHVAKDKDLELIAVALQPIPKQSFDHLVTMVTVDNEGNSLEAVSSSVCQQTSEYLLENERGDLFTQLRDPLDIGELEAQHRQVDLRERYDFHNGLFHIRGRSLPDEVANADKVFEVRSPPIFHSCDVYISHSLRDQKYAECIGKLLRQRDPGVTILDSAKTAGTAAEVDLITGAQCLLVLLSPWYLNSTKEVENFNVILGQERAAPQEERRLYVVIIDELPPKPTYFHLVPCDTCLIDDFWLDELETHGTEGVGHFDNRIHTVLRQLSWTHIERIPDVYVMALMKATCDIVYIIHTGQYRESSSVYDANILSVTDVWQTLNPVADDGDIEADFSLEGDLDLAEEEEGGDPGQEALNQEQAGKVDGEVNVGQPEHRNVKQHSEAAAAAAAAASPVDKSSLVEDSGARAMETTPHRQPARPTLQAGHKTRTGKQDDDAGNRGEEHHSQTGSAKPKVCQIL